MSHHARAVTRTALHALHLGGSCTRRDSRVSSRDILKRERDVLPDYAVFSRRILTGTISDLSPATRIAWIAILFEAEKLRGRVKLPVRDLAKLASITTPEAEATP